MQRCNTRFFKWVLILGLNLGLSNRLLSQHIFVQTFDNIPGHYTNNFHDIEQSTDGAMWFVTQVGVVRYDGVNWKKLPDSLRIPYSFSTHMVPLKNGGMAFAGVDEDGNKVITILNAARQNQETIAIPGAFGEVDHFVVWEYEDRIWAGHSNSDSIYLYNPSIGWLTSPLKSDNANISEVFKLKHDENNLLLLTNAGVYATSDLKYFNKIETGEIESPVYNLYITAGKDTMFFVGNKYLAMRTNGKTRTLRRTRSYPRLMGRIDSDIQMDYPHIYFTCTGPIVSYNIEDGSSFEITGHARDSVTLWKALKIDRQSILWMGNYRGLSKAPTRSFINYDQYFMEDEVTSILHLKNGMTFLGHNVGFTIVDNERKIIWSYQFKNATNTRVLDVKETDSGILYLATVKSGLLKVNINDKSVKVINDQGLTQSVNFRNDTLWVGKNLGIYSFVNDRLINVVKKVAYPRRIEFFDEGDPVLLTTNGVIRVSAGDEQVATRQFSDMYNIFYSINYENKRLLATLNGIYTYENQQSVPFIIDMKHFDRPVYSMAVDGHNDLWLGTAIGVYQIRDRKVLNLFTADNGMSSNEVNRGAFSFDQNGVLWIGTDKGLTLYNPKLNERANIPPKINLSALRSSSRSYNPYEEQTIDFESRSLEFEFDIFSYYNERLINFEYKLEGNDKDWISVDIPELRSIKYHALAPGDYQFKIRAREFNKAWSDIEQSALITVIQPFYYSIWFIVVCLLGIIFVIFIVVNYVNQRRLATVLNQQLQEKMQEVFESKNELELQNEELKRMNEELDSFVYSVSHDLRAPVASSKGLVGLIRKDQDNYLRYANLIEESMNRMDTFIQNVLAVGSNARREIFWESVSIPLLVDEIVAGQKFREGADRVQVNVHCDPETIVTDKKRFSILLTNLISNSINYADHHKEQPQVTVKMHLVKDHYVLVVEDNGIGIKPEYLNSVFKIFYRANETAVGSGLGLYIAEQVLVKLGGRIAIESKYGKWTRFTITHPIINRH